MIFPEKMSELAVQPVLSLEEMAKKIGESCAIMALDSMKAGNADPFEALIIAFQKHDRLSQKMNTAIEKTAAAAHKAASAAKASASASQISAKTAQNSVQHAQAMAANCVELLKAENARLKQENEELKKKLATPQKFNAVQCTKCNKNECKYNATATGCTRGDCKFCHGNCKAKREREPKSE